MSVQDGATCGIPVPRGQDSGDAAMTKPHIVLTDPEDIARLKELRQRLANTRCQAGHLTPDHVGKRTRIRIDDDVITGTVQAVEHEVPARWAKLTLAPWGVTLRLESWRHVELLGGEGE